ncbi:MAG: hypothetical protein VKK97_07945 [Synechococcaceae cyanobacterium]|nr:hypothetical protein [Synechococcaceae cyanobacterium]
MTITPIHRPVVQELLSLIRPSIIPTLAVICWLQLTGTSVGLAGMAWIFLFLQGSTCWAAVCRRLWSSVNTVSSYLPLGFGLCSLLSLALMALRLGTILSCCAAILLGLLSALGCACLRLRRPPIPDAPPPVRAQLLLSQLAAALIATFLLANQLLSSASLHDLTGTSVLNAWADGILHANTVLSLSLLPAGTAPISTLDPTISIIPYHYIAYALPAFLVSTIPDVNPLISFLAVVAPLGMMLLLLPITEKLLLAAASLRRPAFAWSQILWFIAIVLLAYATWTRSIGNAFQDPLWLLITGPATLYACAMVVSGLQIAVGQPRQPLPGPVAAAALTTLVLVLSAFSKLQVAHSIALASLTLILLSGYQLIQPDRRLRLRDHGLVALLGLAGVGALLVLNAMFDVARAHPLEEWLSFLQLTAHQAWSGQPAVIALVSRAPTAAALLGVLTLAGPLFLVGLLPSLRRGALEPTSSWLIALIFASYLVGLLVSPAMPWDGREFQNRSWPLLWSIGIWLLAGLRLSPVPTLTPWQLAATALAMLTLAGILMPAAKWTSAASSPIAKDWTASYYPTTIRSADKTMARAMLPYRGNTFFFARSNPVPGRNNLDDEPSRLAALSGMRPLWSRLVFQTQLADFGDQGSRRPLLQARYQHLLDSAIEACGPVRGERQRIARIYEAVERHPAATAYALCDYLDP